VNGFRRAFVLAILLLSIACAPRGLKQLYVPLGAGAGYGYTEQAAGDRRFQISYVAPLETAFTFAGNDGRIEKETQLARAFDLALLRSADVALANGAPGFRVSDRVNDVDVHSYPSYRNPFWYPGWYRPYYHPYAWPYWSYYDDSYETLSVRVTLTVELVSDVEAGAYDALNVQATIQARYAVPSPG
jgi:hypothetical protein